MQILKILASFAGIGALVVSAGLVLGGAVVLATTSDSGYTTVPTVRISDPGTGIVAEHVDIYFDGYRDGVSITPFDLRVRADIDSAKEVFVGVGPRAMVFDYLDEVGLERSDLLGGEARLTAGNDVTISDPADQDFWVATNIDDRLDWRITEGDYAVVLMNRDGSAGFDTTVDAAFRIPFLRPAGGALIGLGAMGAAAGVALMYVAFRREDPPPNPEGVAVAA